MSDNPTAPPHPIAKLLRYDDPFAPMFPDAPENVRIDCDTIVDWDSFHRVCREEMRFPEFYGNNMNAWMDCMSSMRQDNLMSRFRLDSGQVLLIELAGHESFRQRLPDVFSALLDCVGAVNHRYRSTGYGPALAILFVDSEAS